MSKLMAFALTMSIAAGVAAQPNDDCASPEAFAGFGTVTFDTTTATSTGPAIGCAGGDIFADVWFCWTAPSTGPVRAYTCGLAGFDSVIAVYDGCSCPGVGEIACSDDACGFQSAATFDAVAGHFYLIRVGGYDETSIGTGSVGVEAYIPGVVRGPIVSPINGHTYYTLEPSSWTEGAASARNLGGYLATIRSAEENLWVFNEMMRWDGALRRGWIGLNDVEEEGNFVWQSGEPVSYTAWGGGEPNDSGGLEDYAQIPWWAPEWNDNQDLPTDDPVYPIVEIAGDSCRPDFNDDGFLDFFDFDEFVICFEGGACPPGKSGDYNNDGFADFFDYDEFVADFEAGC